MHFIAPEYGCEWKCLSLDDFFLELTFVFNSVFSRCDARDRHLLVRDVRTGDGRAGDPGQRRQWHPGDGRADRGDDREPGPWAAEGLHIKVPEQGPGAEAQRAGAAVSLAALRGALAEAAGGALSSR